MVTLLLSRNFGCAVSGGKKKRKPVRCISSTYARCFSFSRGGFIQSNTLSLHVLVGYFPSPVCHGARSCCYPHHLVFVSQDGSSSCLAGHRGRDKRPRPHTHTRTAHNRCSVVFGLSLFVFLCLFLWLKLRHFSPLQPQGCPGLVERQLELGHRVNSPPPQFEQHLVTTLINPLNVVYFKFI